MKCKSCNSIVDAKFKFALTQNVCPYCGEAIMEEELRSVISDLSKALIKYDLFKEQIESWLLANYSFVSLNSNNFKDLIPENVKKDLTEEITAKVKNDVKTNLSLIKEKNKNIENADEEEQEDSDIVLKSKEDSADFFRRAGVKEIPKPSEKNQRLKSALAKIQEVQETDDSEESESIEEFYHETLPDIINTSSVITGNDEDVLSAVPTNRKEAKDLAALQRLVNKSKQESSFKRSS